MSRPRPGPPPRPVPGRAGGRWGKAAALLAAVAVVTVVIVLVVRPSSDTPSAEASTSGAAAGGARDAGAQVTDTAVANGYLAATTSNLAAVSSYDYRRLDAALTAGQAVTTGRYRTAYTKALTGSLAAAARRNHTVQDFTPVRIGIGEIAANGTTAKVLVFGTQKITTGTSGRETRSGLVTLTATLVRNGAQYLISDLESGTNAGLPPGTPGLRVAAEAGREAVARRARMPVTALAVERALGSSLVLLVVTAGQGRYEVTVVMSGRDWRVTAIATIGSS